jgi:hypothetical protein
MSLKGLGKKEVVAYQGNYHGICLERLRKARNTRGRIAAVPAEFRAENQPNTTIQSYCLSQLAQ